MDNLLGFSSGSLPRPRKAVGGESIRGGEAEKSMYTGEDGGLYFGEMYLDS